MRDTSTTRVHDLVAAIRRRWRRRALVQGGALALLVLLAGATLWLLFFTLVPAAPGVRLAVALATAAAVLGVVAWYVVRPFFQKISDAQIALYVEERLPELEDRLNSAVEVEESEVLRREHGAVLDRLVDDAARRARGIAPATVVDRKRERVLAYAAGTFLLLFLVFGFSVRDRLVVEGDGPGLAVLAAARPLLTVQPGDAEVERGASQEVVVLLRDAPTRPMVLVFKEGEGAWQRVEMQQGTGEAAAFLHEFFAIQEPIRYYIEYGEARSEPFTITLYEFPAVARIDLTYRFPEYTGLAPRTEEDTGDIRGLKGSTVTLDVHATGAVETAALVLDSGAEVPLRAGAEGRYRAALRLEEPGFYTVRLTDAQGKQNRFPVEYLIEPVEDQPPFVTITDPQRDLRANAVEEVLVAAEVADDYGVKDLRLRFSVNGDPEQTVALMHEAAARAPEAAGEHLLFLEDYTLQPGDVISYYVEAEDFFHAAPEATDMYFIEVIPFAEEYRQAANMPGQGQQPSGLVLSQQDIIAATWRLLRERDAMDPDAFDEAREALVQAQATLKAEIEQRLNSTAFSLELRANEEQQAVVEHLRKATDAMADAVVELRADRLRPALTPERKALTHLRRAEAQNTENQVAQGQGQGQAGATEERMTELMDLELDISKDKYETQQQRQQQQQQEMDETLEKLRELARRQQNLANQPRPEQMDEDERRRFIDRLQRDQDGLREQAEQMAQQLQQQSRQQGGQNAQGRQQAREAQQQMERVAEDMRRAEQALRRGDADEALRRQQQALNRIEDLQRDLQLTSADGARRQAEALAEQFEQLRRQEQQLADDLERTAEDARQRGGTPDRAALDRLQQQRAQARAALRALDDGAAALEERLRADDPEAAMALREARKQMQRDRLSETMDASGQALDQGWMDRAERLEKDILRALDNLETMRQAFDQSLPAAEDEQLARALDEIRDLQREMEALQQQTSQAERPGQGEQQGQQPGGEQQGGQAAGQGGQDRAEAARRQRQLQNAQQRLERLQRELGGNPALQRPLQQLQNNLARADHTGILLDEAAAKQYFDRNIFTPLSQLETELARRLDLVELEKKLFGGRRGDVPAEYRVLVEKYYEALSKGGGR
ncbi:MAG: DUF4175 family protein [Rhodothermales bacterium]|nr:DUF4175 family protein [Rhodothermales bacterium]